MVPKRNFMPCLARYLPSVTKTHAQLLRTHLAKLAAISVSMPGHTLSPNSMTSTSAPSRRHTLPSSRPMTPAPMSTIFFGILVSDSAPVEDTTTFSSNLRKGSSMGSLPAAMMMFLVSMIFLLPSVMSTCTVLGPAILP